MRSFIAASLALPLLCSAAINVQLVNSNVLAIRDTLNQPAALPKRQATTSSAAAAAATTTAAGSATSSSALQTIIQLITPKCNSTCQVAIDDLSGCAALPDQASIASCACSSVVLGDIRTCAACISSNTTTPNSVTVVNQYNAFVNLCVSDGLASVTGTVSVGASTSPISRPASSSTAGSSKASSAVSRAYNVSSSHTGTATNVANLATASGSVAASASASATAKSGANRERGTVLKRSVGALVVVALGLVVLA